MSLSTFSGGGETPKTKIQRHNFREERSMATKSEKPVIAVTGGGQGIGRAILLYFAERGYNVAVLDRNAETIEAVAGECRALGSDALPIYCDVTDRPCVAEAYEKIGGYFGRWTCR
jgi:3-oxoacyl-[acyl-carrier protein] reductase